MCANAKNQDVKARLEKWLLEENYKVESLTNNHALFNLVVEDNSGLKLHVRQPLLSVDQIVVMAKASLSEEQITKIQKMLSGERTRFLWELRFSLLEMGIDFSSVSLPLKFVLVSSPIYFDGLTKNAFMTKVFAVRRALVFVMWKVSKELGEAKLPFDTSGIV